LSTATTESIPHARVVAIRPREAQIRFYSYAATSAQPIATKNELEEKRKAVAIQYQDKPLPISEFYCGFRIKPVRIMFYAYRTDELSDVIEYQWVNNCWTESLLSP
jgi:pyridoxamine 5'-phosphate oxidase